MSNPKIKDLIAGVKNGNVELINITVDDLKKIQGKTFKQIVEKNPEALHPFGQRLNWYEFKKVGRGIKKVQKNADLFSVDEIIAAGKKVTENGKDLLWIPNGKGEYVNLRSREGADAVMEKSGRANSATEVYEIPAIGAIDYKTGTIMEPEAKTYRVAKAKANAQWHAITPIYTKEGTKKESKMSTQLAMFKEELEAAKKRGDKEMVEVYEALINSYMEQIEVNRENGAKAVDAE